MNILDAIGGTQGHAARQLARQFGLNEQQVSTALSSLAPALAAGFQKNMSDPQGLQSLIGALSGGNHQRYVEEPDTLTRSETVEDGNGILGHVFGSKDVSRQVASRVSTKTGIGEGVLKSMLPVVAAMMMGAMSKQVKQTGETTAATGGGGLLGMLTPLLDSNRDGSIGDDVVGIVGRMLSGR